jgi:hypothetical protein
VGITFCDEWKRMEARSMKTVGFFDGEDSFNIKCRKGIDKG